MSQSLPTHVFKWMKNLTIDTLMSILDKANCSMTDPKEQGVSGGCEPGEPDSPPADIYLKLIFSILLSYGIAIMITLLLPRD